MWKNLASKGCLNGGGSAVPDDGRERVRRDDRRSGSQSHAKSIQGMTKTVIKDRISQVYSSIISAFFGLTFRMRELKRPASFTLTKLMLLERRGRS